MQRQRESGNVRVCCSRNDKLAGSVIAASIKRLTRRVYTVDGSKDDAHKARYTAAATAMERESASSSLQVEDVSQ